MEGDDFVLLRHLDGPTTLAQLSHLSGRDPSRLSRVIPRLRRLGLVGVSRENRRLVVWREGPAAESLVAALDRFPRLPWNSLLSARNLELISFFGTPAERVAAPGGSHEPGPAFVPKAARDAVDWTGQSTSSVYRSLSQLTKTIILRRRASAYFLAPEHKDLHRFADLLFEGKVRAQIGQQTREARIVWQLAKVCMFASGQRLPSVQQAGPSLLAELGVPLILPYHYYLLAPWTPGAADAVLQTYLSEPTSRTIVAYTCLAWAKSQPDNLVERARAYGIPNTARLIIAYAQGPGSVRGLPFPEPEDYIELAEQYGLL